MPNEILMVGPHLQPIIGRLEPGIRVHCYWQAEDPAELLRAIGPRIRALATDAFTGASAELAPLLRALCSLRWCQYCIGTGCVLCFPETGF